MKEYAVYKGDELLVIGTVDECAEKLGVQRNTILFYTYPTYQRRLKKRKASNNVRNVVVLTD
ncbi:hypothetical protein IR194_07825 [Exiguobacterium sp. PBE]|uniref:hypothetical protein n=1 Tax=unclassified Exiguobacterium TaxID=2644629 RepID=UPI0018DAD3B9|nr:MULTISPECIES: hypothetical protein [unclassified Exiguobacterium]QPI66393.1 hypothetical protein IR194_07825 [Exiguobacterium sp. PBE]